MSEEKNETNDSSLINRNNLKIVKAIYFFKGENNDELCFDKDDLIILTQTPEGGWYEGTHLLNRVTGWFPAGYVMPLSSDQAHSLLDKQFIDSFNKDNNFQANRNLAYQELLDNEKSYLHELQNTLHKYLLPLQKSMIFPIEGIELIVESFQKVISSHLKFLNSLESLDSKDQKIGNVFMNHAASLKSVHTEYCSFHPKFIHSIEFNREKMCSFFKQNFKTDDFANESLLLTTGLSLTFRHLDKYPAALQEIHRYTDDAHPDRGNIQRAGFVYRELVTDCLKIRRQKEMELEVMLGNVKNWPLEYESIQSLGNVIYMGAVNVLKSDSSQDDIKKDRYLVLFSNNLLLLTVSNEMTSFVFEKRLALNDVTLPRIPEIQSTKTTFELLYTEFDSNGKLILSCSNPEDVRKWISFMHKCKNKQEDHSQEQNKSSSDQASVNSSENIPNILNTNNVRSKYWANKSLLPHPPFQTMPLKLKNPSLFKSTFSKPVENKYNNTHNNDMLILYVIEAYCNVGKIKTKDKACIREITNNEKTEAFKKYFPRSKHSNLNYHYLQGEIDKIKSEINLLTSYLKNEQRARKKLKAKLEQIQKKIN